MALHIRILKLDTKTKTIEVACPHCSGGVAFSREKVMNLVAGVEIVGVCPRCHRQFDIAPRELDELPWLEGP